MCRVAADHRLQYGDDLGGARCGRAVLVPQLPGTQVHQALGKECGRVEVVGIELGELAHGLHKGHGELRIVGIGVAAVTRLQSLDVGTLRRGAAGGKRQRFLHRVVSRLLPGRVHGQVVVRPDGEGHTPPRHRHFRIEFGGAAEGAFGLVVIEGIEEAETLVEKLLRFGAGGGNRVMMIAQAFHQGRGLCEGERAGKKKHEQRTEHRGPPERTAKRER